MESSQFGKVGQTASSEPVQTTPTKQKVTALGRLEPEAEVINLFAPLALDGDRVAQILVKEGDRVKAGQIVSNFRLTRSLANCCTPSRKTSQSCPSETSSSESWRKNWRNSGTAGKC